jgi:hypothetical protein
VTTGKVAGRFRVRLDPSGQRTRSRTTGESRWENCGPAGVWRNQTGSQLIGQSQNSETAPANEHVRGLAGAGAKAAVSSSCAAKRGPSNPGCFCFPGSSASPIPATVVVSSNLVTQRRAFV